MSVYLEFLLVAVALYLWESALWLPLRGVVLRKSRFGGKWRVLDPRSWFATRELGLIPMLPLSPDAGLAPCQVPPMMSAGPAEWLMETPRGTIVSQRSLSWNDMKVESHHLGIAEARFRISSHRYTGLLRRARKRGLSVSEAFRLSWRMALSPGRAGREWKRWKKVSDPLQWHGMLLTVGFFAGLPMVYVWKGSFPALMLGLWLWALMISTAVHLWWLGNRVYPDARAALRMDALLALLVPFHAMRACELASVHAMATVHPAALLVWARDFDNPWLSGFVRRILHPAPAHAGDVLFAGTLHPLVSRLLASRGKCLEDYDREPGHGNDHDAKRYCPRCHGLFTKTIQSCPDCHGLALKNLS